MKRETLKLVVDKVETDAIFSGKIKVARSELDSTMKRVKTALDAHARKPLKGDEELVGLSTYQASDVFDQNEGSFPPLMGRVLATDHLIRVKGDDQVVAKAFLVKAREEIANNNQFYLYACAIKDGLMGVAGAVKLWYARTYKKIVDQRQGVDEEKKAILEALLEAGEIQGLECVPLPVESALFDPGDGITAPMQVQGARLYDCKVTLTELEKSGVVIMPIPQDQVLLERGKAFINDKRGCGHQTVMTVGELLAMQERLSLPDEPFFEPEALERAIAVATKDEGSGQQSLREGREELHFEGAGQPRADYGLTASRLRRPITMTEWSDSVVAGEKMESALLWYGGEICLRAQKNADGIVPLCLWSPFFVPHSVIGMGVGEQHICNQDSRTAMGRSLINHIARVADEETYILDAGTDILGLRNRAPGQLIYAKPGKDFERIPTNSLDAKLFQGMDWLSTETQNVGPSNRWTMGRDVDPRNTTARGQELMATASSTRQNMISLVFTEMFQVDLYNKIIKLLQANSEGFTVVVDGEEVTVTPDMMKGSYTAFSEIGRQFDMNDTELGRATLVAARVAALRSVGSPIATDLNLYNAEKKVFIAAGEPVVSDYLTNPQTLPPPMGPAPPGFPPGMGRGGAMAPPVAPDQARGQDVLDNNLGGF